MRSILWTGYKVERGFPASIHPSTCSLTTGLCTCVACVALPLQSGVYTESAGGAKAHVLWAMGQPGGLKTGVGGAAEASR